MLDNYFGPLIFCIYYSGEKKGGRLASYSKTCMESIFKNQDKKLSNKELSTNLKSIFLQQKCTQKCLIIWFFLVVL